MARLRTKGSCTSGRGKRASTVPADTAPGKAGSQAQDTFYRDLVWSMRNGVLAIRRDGRVAVINGEAYRILGLKPEATDIGRPYTDVLGPCHDVAQILSTAFKLNYLPNRAELRLKTTGKVIGYTLSLIRDGNKRTTAGAALFFKDLTRVEQLEERERLRDRLAALGEMAAAIAHEVKNPLAGIQVMAGILKRQVPDSADAQGILNDIISEAQTANLIVLEVLEFVRPIRLELDPVSLNDVLRDSLTMAESQVARGAIGVSIELANNVPNIHGDHIQLRRVFTNLLTNAFEALEGKGTIRISASLIAEEQDGVGEPSEAANLVVIDVADNGPGVPAHVTDRMFSPFFTTKPQGSGLGLAIVRKIVDAHDGRIDVDSRRGRGTRFRVALPVLGVRDHSARGRASRATKEWMARDAPGGIAETDMMAQLGDAGPPGDRERSRTEGEP